MKVVIDYNPNIFIAITNNKQKTERTKNTHRFIVIHSQYESYTYSSVAVGFHYDEGKVIEGLNLVFDQSFFDSLCFLTLHQIWPFYSFYKIGKLL